MNQSIARFFSGGVRLSNHSRAASVSSAFFDLLASGRASGRGGADASESPSSSLSSLPPLRGRLPSAAALGGGATSPAIPLVRYPYISGIN